jgi:ABC-2 type transport system permease protein
MFKIAKKDLKIFIADRKAVLITFLLPIALITLFALAFGAMGGSSKPKPKVLLYVDLDQSATTQGIVTKLDSSKNLSLKKTTEKEGVELVKSGDELAVILFHSGFEDSVKLGKAIPLEMRYDEAREMEIGFIQGALMSQIMEAIGPDYSKTNIDQQIEKNYAHLGPEIVAQIKQQAGNNSGEKQQSGITITKLERSGNTNWALVQAVAGTAVMMLLFSVAGIGAGLMEERDSGTLRKLMYAPIHPNQLLYGKMITALIISTIQLLVMFVFASLVFGLDLSMNATGLLIMIAATAFTCSSFGIFIASISRSRKQAEGLTTIVVLSMSAIGGSMMPLPVMPDFMQNIAVISVNYWSIQGFYDIFWREQEMINILIKAGVLIGIGITMLLVSIAFFKKNIVKMA